jgi:hypothetical protein
MPRTHLNFFGRAYCQRDNWRSLGQCFLLAKKNKPVTCRACAKRSVRRRCVKCGKLQNELNEYLT